MRIERLTPETAAAGLDGLAALLSDTVESGGSIGFLQPCAPATALAFWRDQVIPKLADRQLALFVARDGDAIVGTVQLHLDTPPNQPHRVDVAKMMVAPSHRRQGVGRALLDAALAAAAAQGRTLATLDTRSGDPSQRLYEAAGFEIAGAFPDYAVDPDGRGLHATTLMFKRL